MLQKFALAVLVAASKDPDVQKFVDDRLANLIAPFKDDITEVKDGITNEVIAELHTLRADLIGLFPAFGTSIIKSAFDHLPQIPNLPAAADLASSVAQNVLDLGHGLPVIGQFTDILRGFLR
jgi:hypothetical protein